MLINSKNSKAILFVTLLGLVLPPLGNDIYFSSLPSMAHEFKTTHIQLIVSFYLLGFSLGQLFYGPLSDRFGRKPLMITALTMTLLGCVLVLLTHNYSLLLLARFIQALGSCGILCMALAIIRDSYHKEEIVKVNAVVFALLGFVPALAPLLGSYIATYSNWRMDFLLLVVVAALILMSVVLLFSESSPEKNANALDRNVIIKSYLRLLRNKPYLQFTLVSCFSYAAFFSFICASPYLLIKPFNLSLTNYGWILAFNSICVILTGFLIPWLTKRFEIASLAAVGAVMILAGGVLMLLLNTVMNLGLYGVIIPSFIVFSGVGFIRPTASAGALTQAPKDITGSASSLFSFLAFIGGALFSVLGQFAGGSVYRLAVIIVIAGVATLAAALLAAASVKRMKLETL